ncbi:MAG: hypothetical protein EOP84_15450 [Verrucomicrobiaceae bacterium]|nr:MAG: hypothetical protein EOP84_15450 [Verrucomicrobiaceae bacterium]
MTVLGLPVAALMIGWFGYLDGVKMRIAVRAPLTITMKDESGAREIQASGLRQFTTTAIFVAKDGHVEIVPLSSILRVERAGQRTKSVMCRLASVGCSL